MEVNLTSSQFLELLYSFFGVIGLLDPIQRRGTTCISCRFVAGPYNYTKGQFRMIIHPLKYVFGLREEAGARIGRRCKIHTEGSELGFEPMERGC